MNKEISIKKDGNCLFRSIVCALHTDLYNAKRRSNGRILSRNLSILEDKLSKSLRFLVTNYISRNKNKYEEDIDGCSKFLDGETFNQHLIRMEQDGEFAEYLEISALSDMLNITINVYVKKDDDFNLIYSINEENKIINLLLCEDHYSILKSDCIESSRELPARDINISKHTGTVNLRRSQRLINQNL